MTLNQKRKLALVFVVGLHFGIEIFNIVSLGLCIYYGPLYFAIPLLVLMTSPALAGDGCVLTRAENYLRDLLGLEKRNTNLINYYCFGGKLHV